MKHITTDQKDFSNTECTICGGWIDGYRKPEQCDCECPSFANSKSDKSKLPDYDYVNPSHYKNQSHEVWEMMVAIWGKEKYIAHCEMCAFKYRQRLGSKPDQPIERDLAKAKWYEDKARELSRDNIEELAKKFFNAENGE